MCVSVSANLDLGVHAPGSSRAQAGPGRGVLGVPCGAGQGLQKVVEAQWAADSESSCPGGGRRAGRLRQP